MTPQPWSSDDLRVMREIGIPPEEAERQLALFRDPPPFIQLARPASLGDGILRMDEAAIQKALEAYETARKGGRFMKFVPASGAASRMFQLLSKFAKKRSVHRRDLQEKARRGDKEAEQLLGFMGSLGHLALVGPLREKLAEKGRDLAVLLSEGDFLPILKALLSEEGLDYSRTPKGLIPFHESPAGPRTPFEEQLIEAIHTVQDGSKRCRVHFTISPDQEKAFQEHLSRTAPSLEKSFGVQLVVDLSSQKDSSQTLAADLSDRPFREKKGWFSKGRLLFRPGGHGALLDNLNDLKADLVLIKNIDNVPATAHARASYHWKKVLGGLLVLLQEEVFSHLGILRSGSATPDQVEAARRFAQERLGFQGEGKEELLRFLDRPLRVCGVVPNSGEPGGGPFWVRGADGKLSLQIVESAQVDPQDPGQAGILKGSTHFNPVDIACGLRDQQGRPFDLHRYRDPKAVFLSRKSHKGKDLKALEHPGLWNGSMADWITIFVEVPSETFHPVKTVLDLLKPAHRTRTPTPPPAQGKEG